MSAVFAPQRAWHIPGPLGRDAWCRWPPSSYLEPRWLGLTTKIVCCVVISDSSWWWFQLSTHLKKISKIGSSPPREGFFKRKCLKPPSDLNHVKKPSSIHIEAHLNTTPTINLLPGYASMVHSLQ